MIVIRRTRNEWANANPILRNNEIGQELNTARIKIGDNKTPWNSLPFIDVRPSANDPLPETIDAGSP